MKYKYLIYSLIFTFSPIIAMEKKSEKNEPKVESKLNLLPCKLKKVIIENCFYVSDQGLLQDALAIIDWNSLTIENIEIINEMLEMPRAKKHTSKILEHISKLQAGICAIEKENCDPQLYDLIIKLNTIIKCKAKS